ncbi:hypothetical protein ACO0RG_001740 [Hanseniaspora osmophila]
MGVGDLNLLKSWNPNLLKNKKKVWQHEEELLQEEKKFKEKQQEIAKNRELEEYNALLGQSAGKPVKRTGLEWIADSADSAESGKVKDAVSQKTFSTNTVDAAALGIGKNKSREDAEKNTDRDILLGKKQYRGTSHIRTDDYARREQRKKALDRDDPMAGFMSKQKRKPIPAGNDRRRMELDKNDPMAAYKQNNRHTRVYKKKTYK